MKNINKVSVKFVGASSTGVTGSSVLISYYDKDESKHQFLIEHGLSQGGNVLEEYKINNQNIKDFKPKNLEFILTSHLHFDHVGLIPKLYKKGAKCPLIVPANSTPFIKHMALDGAFICERDVEVLNKQYKKASLKPIYGNEDVYEMLDHIQEIGSQRKVKLNNEVSIEYVPSGHIELAHQIVIWIKKPNNSTVKILYTGDLGNPKIEKVFCNKFTPVDNCNLLIGEATYNNPLRSFTKDTRLKDLEKIKTIVDETCINNKGRCLFAIFSLQRCQDMLYELYKIYGNDKDFKIPIYIDSPLAIKLTKDFQNMYNETDLEKAEIFNSMLDWENVNYIKAPENHIKLLKSNKPCIVLCGSAFLTAGRSVSWVQELLPQSNNHILICGYSGEEGSIGWQIQHSKNSTLSVAGKKVRANCKVTGLKSFSSHMQYEELMNYYSNVNTQKIVIHHSDKADKKRFAKNLQDLIYKKNKTGNVVVAEKNLEIKI